MTAKSASQVQQVTCELVQDLLGFLKLCIHDANMSGADDAQ